MPKINIVQLRKDLKPAINSLANLAYGAALEKFNAARSEMISEFYDHPVTRELKGGPEASNESFTLDGYGNLFSFIGFYEGEDPTVIVEDSLKEMIELRRTPKIFKSNTLVQFSFDVIIPSLEDFEAVTPYPDEWNSGSWLVDIEYSIPNMRYYIYKEDELIERSRSGPAVQVKNVLRGNESFSRIKYISEILRNFREKIERIVV